MYPISEFRTVGLRASRRMGFAILAAVGTLFLFALTAFELSEPWGHYEATQRILLVWGTVVAVGLTLACEVGAKLARHPYTHCPHCHCRLSDHVPLVVSSGCCPQCGLQVLEPPTDDSTPDALIPRADFLASDSSYQNRIVPVVVAGVMATYLGCGGAFISLERLRLVFPLNWVVFLMLLLVAPVSLVAVLRWFMAGGKRNPALACPTCGKLLAGARMLVASTGHCCLCGSRAITPRVRPLAPPHLAPSWTVDRINTVVAARRHRWQFAWMLTAAIVAVTLGLIPLFLRMCDQLQPGDWWSWYQMQTVKELGPWVLAAGGLASIGLVWRRVSRYACRRHPLDCPRCGQEFLQVFAISTKCCNRCGWQIVAGGMPIDEESPPPARTTG